MALKIFYDKDADLGRLDGKTVAILGYGSQGHAHALNLKASGVDVVVGLRKDSPTVGKAERSGLRVLGVAEAAAKADITMMTLPDESMGAIYREHVAPNLQPGKYLAVAHGFNIHFGVIRPPADVNVFMVAPKGPGHTVRAHYEEGRGVPVAGRGAPGPDRRHAPDRARLRGRDRRGPRRDHRDELPRGDRDRSVRRADRAVRRARRADDRGLRDAGRGRLLARDGLLRDDPRGEADRRPDLRRRHREHALLGLEHRRVRRPHARPARDRRRHARRACARSCARSRPARSRASSSSRTRPAGCSSPRCAAAARSTRWRRSARGCAS